MNKEMFTSVWKFSSKKDGIKNPKFVTSLPYDLCEMLIKIGSKRNDLILDPFSGSGQIILSALNNGRIPIGIDINPDFIELSKKRLKNFKRYKLVNADICELVKKIKSASFDAIITHPPYANVYHYSNDERDLSNFTYCEFLTTLEFLFKEFFRILKTGKFFIYVIGDIIKHGEFYPLHIDLAVRAYEAGFIPQPYGIWQLEGLMYMGWQKPYRIIGNGNFNHFQLHHNYICVFRKGNS